MFRNGARHFRRQLLSTPTSARISSELVQKLPLSGENAKATRNKFSSTIRPMGQCVMSDAEFLEDWIQNHH